MIFGIFGMFGMGWGYAPKTGQGRADGAGLEAEFRRGSFYGPVRLKDGGSVLFT